MIPMCDLRRGWRLAAALLGLGLPLAGALAQNEVPVTYQGRLTDGMMPADGNYDFNLNFYAEPLSGNIVLPGQFIEGVEVVDGLFTLVFDYSVDGAVGEPRWLSIGVRPTGSADPFTLLEPRQRITAVPEAGNTAAARLQPDGSVQVGAGIDLGVGSTFSTYSLPNINSLAASTLSQTFIAEQTGVPDRVVGFFNESGVPINITAEIYAIGSNPGLVAMGVARNVTTSVREVFFSGLSGVLLADEPYELRISYRSVVANQPDSRGETGVYRTDVYAGGELVGFPNFDMNVDVQIDRGPRQMIVFESGLASIANGLVVGPSDSGDLGVKLPRGSVNPTEMLGEPGLIRSVAPDLAFDPNQTMRVARVMPPTDGFVLAIATAQISGPIAGVYTVTLSSSQNPLTFSQSISVAGGGGDIPLTLQGVFPVTANEQIDIYFRKDSFSSPITPLGLNAIFLPSLYEALTPVSP